MRQIRSATMLLSLALSGCASGSTVVSTATPIQSIGATGTNDRMTLSPGSGPNVNTLAYSADAIWRVVPAAFDSIGVTVTRLEPATKVIGNDGFKIRQRLGKTNLSRYIDCGQTQIGPNADDYEVHILLVVQVRPVTLSTSSLVTTFEASARPIAFSQGYSRCTSRGSLEAKLLTAIAAQLGK